MFVGAHLSGVVVNQYSFPQVEPAKFQKVADITTWTEGNIASWETAGQRGFGKIKTIAKDAGTATLEAFTRDGSSFKPGAELVTQPLASLSKPLPLWNKIWQLPALGALGILALFAMLFTYREPTAAPAKQG
jgi:hypothetical protein